MTITTPRRCLDEFFSSLLVAVRDWVEYDDATDTTSVFNHLDYDAFGNIVLQSNTNHTPQFGFTGQDWDADVGLYHYYIVYNKRDLAKAVAYLPELERLFAELPQDDNAIVSAEAFALYYELKGEYNLVTERYT